MIFNELAEAPQLNQVPEELSLCEVSSNDSRISVPLELVTSPVYTYCEQAADINCHCNLPFVLGKYRGAEDLAKTVDNLIFGCE